MESSYKKNSFDKIFKSICSTYTPSSILEIGILDGYSLNSFLKYSSSDTKIKAIDLFEEYEYKSATFSKINDQFLGYKNLSIEYGDFYKYYLNKKKFDIIHIDISNDGEIYKFALENYYPLTNKLLILEGGSRERDKVDWMVNYEKVKINSFLETINNKYDFETIEKFPSVTIFYKTKRKDLDLNE